MPPVSFRRADKNGNRNLERDEWDQHVETLEKFREGYETHGLLAIPINSKGLVAADQVRRLTTSGIPEVPSPVTDGQRIYLVKNGGLLSCVDIASGKTIYRTRTRGRGTHYASPLIAADKLYAVAGDGRVSVMAIGIKPELLAVNELGDNGLCNARNCGRRDLLFARIRRCWLSRRTYNDAINCALASRETDGKSVGMCHAIDCLAGIHLAAVRRLAVDSNDSDLQMLIQSACIDCHNKQTETGLDLTSLSMDFQQTTSASHNGTFRQWVRVFDRVQRGEMPPASADHPAPAVKQPHLNFWAAN